MKLVFTLNDKKVTDEIPDGMLLLDYLRSKGCFSVKRGCETANCGLCTVLMDGKPVLSCSLLAARVQGRRILTLEGLQEKAKKIGGYLADKGADQCGFCNPGFIMNVIAMEQELTDPDEEQIKEYLSGNLCRCSGFVSQTAAILQYLNEKKEVC